MATQGLWDRKSNRVSRQLWKLHQQPEFIPFIKEKLEVHQKDLNETTYEFVKQQDVKIDFENQINKLPYIFKAPHTLDKKIDVKKFQFGSKIDKDRSTTREELYTVKKIISPEKILLTQLEN